MLDLAASPCNENADYFRSFTCHGINGVTEVDDSCGTIRIIHHNSVLDKNVVKSQRSIEATGV